MFNFGGVGFVVFVFGFLRYVSMACSYAEAVESAKVRAMPMRPPMFPHSVLPVKKKSCVFVKRNPNSPRARCVPSEKFPNT
jgi:hypothetical protein